MKTNFFTLIVMAIGILASTSAFAQPTIVASSSSKEAKDGSTVTYSVTGSGTFHWSLDGGSSTNTVLTSTSSTVEITWDDATPGETYNLSVYLEDASGCYSELYQYKITINPVILSIANVETETCAWLGIGNTSGNEATPANDIIEFTVSTDEDGAQTPLDVSYSITATDVDGSGTAVNATGSDEVALSSNSGTLEVEIDSNFINTSEDDVIYTITITSVTDDKGNTLDVNGTNNTATITIHPTPVITLN